MDKFLFPHDKIRDIQEDFLSDASEAIEKNKHFLAHAPTGLGKTTILGPALFQGLKKQKTVFFLTPMHTQHKIAVDTLAMIKKKHGIDMVVVDFIGKKWMCQQPGIHTLSSSEFSEYCSDLIDKGLCEYYENLKKGTKFSVKARAVFDEIKEKNPLGVEEVCKICSKNKLCPYEISSILAQKADVIIGDYFHVLSPSVRDVLFKKIGKDLEKSILIFDEGHNLPAKTRDLLSNNLSTLILEPAIKEAKRLGFKETAADMLKIQEILEKFSQEKTSMEKNEALVTKKEFLDEMEPIGNYNELINNLHVVAEQALEDKKRSFSVFVASFLEAWTGPEDGFARILKKGFTKQGKAFITLAYRCMDPSMILKPLSTDANIVVMSGTLSPLQMYKDLFGFESESKEYPDPFPKKNRLNLIVPKTSTKFTARSEEMYQKIAIMSSKIVNAIPGNSVIFFPSYALRDEVNKHFQQMCEKTTFLEQKKMSKLDREEMLERFKQYKKHGAVLLAVSAGSFGEGVDLPGDLLKGVVVVGLPLPKPDLETNKIIEYYDRRFKRGWDYGYLYPAILKVIQNAGRCIRSKEDKGIVVFLDERYSWQNYYRCFPKEWSMKITRMPIGEIEEFFEKEE